MQKPFELHSVEAEKAEAMRRYNNRKTFRNILRIFALALLVYLWFPTVAFALQTVSVWLYRTGLVIVTNRIVVFIFANLLVALILLISRDSDNDESIRDFYDEYTSSFVHDDSKKQTVPAEVVVEANVEEVKEVFRRAKSEKKKKICQPVRDFRRTESAKLVAIERLSSEEFRLKVESFIMEKKLSLVKENDVVKSLSHRHALTDGNAYGYDSC